MKLTELTLKNKTVAFVLSFLLVIGGIFSYNSLGRLEFPAFTIKSKRSPT